MLDFQISKDGLTWHTAVSYDRDAIPREPPAWPVGEGWRYCRWQLLLSGWVSAIRPLQSGSDPRIALPGYFSLPRRAPVR